MADLTAIRTALANQISAQTGLRASAQVKDQLSPPIALVVPGNPLITFGDTMDGTSTYGVSVLLILSDAAPTEKVQRALDVYLGLTPGQSQSIPGAIMADVSLGGAVHWCVPTAVTSYGGVEWNSITFFGARVNCSVGAI